MTSPAPSPSPSVGLGIAGPIPRRAFGTNLTPKPSSEVVPNSLSSSASSTRVPTPQFNGNGTNGQQAYLTASDESSHRRSPSFTADSVKQAQAWLSNWAPRGEGRGRQFVSSTLNGVAGVASQVSHGINGAVNNLGAHVGGEGRAGMGSRPNSFTSPVPPGSGSSGPSSPNSELGSSPDMMVKSPPVPTHTSSSPTVPTSKKVLQPANLSRLGPSSPPVPSHLKGLHRPAMSNPPTSASLPQLPHGAPATPIHGPSLLNPHARPGSASASHSRSPSFGHPPGGSSSRPESAAARGLPITARGAGMPYKVGFQPAGVKNDRSEEFMYERKELGEEREKAEGRLGRRWAKLVDLHFNPNAVPSTSSSTSLPRSASSSLSLSSNGDKRRSLLSIDGALDALKGPKEVWKGVKTNLDPRAGPAADDNRKRAAEQTIVKWQDDSEARKCYICQSSFSLSNRKHHCRLCGKIVCALPPTPPALLAVQNQLLPSSSAGDSSSSSTQAALLPGTRREKCSILLVADWKTGRGEEVDEGFVGWMRLKDGEGPSGSRASRSGSISSVRTVSSAGTGTNGKENGVPVPQQPTEIQVKGIRVCRECWNVVSRKQRIADRIRITGFAKLYQMLRTLQAEIEDTLPDFEDQMELLMASEEPADPDSQLIKAHKNLVALFAQYELLSKRLSSLPSEDGSSQQAVQSAIARSAATFLTKEMVKLQALPRYQKRLAEFKRQSLKIAIVETTLADQLTLDDDGDPEPDPAMALQPLLEQEAQIEIMIADAHAQRKYEDGKALSQALSDIRSEIARVADQVIT